MRNGLGVLIFVLMGATLTGCFAPTNEAAPIHVAPTRNSDDFARNFLDQMQDRSFASNREYCGLFARNAEGFIIATQPVMGGHYKCRPPRVSAGFTPFASYHSHGGFDANVDSEVPSSFDLVADREEGLIGYISTPGGRLWRSEAGKARLLCGPGCLSIDPDFDPGRFAPVNTRYTADELLKRENAKQP